MTEADNRSALPRAGRRFMFLKNGREFFPGVGAQLHFASKSDDTLTLPGMPQGMFAANDAVVCRYAANGVEFETVFSGTVVKIIDRAGRGSERVCDVTVGGPWAKLNRLVFRQKWATKAADGTAATFLFSRVVLNKAVTGEALDMSAQLREILDFGAAKCGYEVGGVSAGTTVLPPDDTRDLTCASAIQRMLRFHPKVVVACDYSGNKPVISVSTPPESEAEYVADIPKTAREYEINACPISAVDIQTNDVTEILDGQVSTAGHQIYPAGADTSALDCLHVYIPLARGSGSNSYESCTLETESMPSYVGHPGFWKDKHPRLANVAQSQITISEATRTGTHNYSYIARNSASELKKAGIHFDKELFRCKCTISTANDIEEDIYLTMEFLTTDKRGGTYTWQTGSSSVAGETLPDGLAQALYEQRTQSQYLNETMTVRLGENWPKLGDYADGLYLQSIDVDCAAELATLHFGQPEYLSAEDMRDLLNGFRGRAYSSVQTIRTNADESDEEADDIAGIPPLSSTEFAPGTKAKTTIASTNGDGVVKIDSSGSSPSLSVSNGSSSITLDTGDIGGDCNGEIKMRKFTFYKGDGTKWNYHILACGDIDLTEFKTVHDVKVEGDEIVFTYNDHSETRIKLPDGSLFIPGEGGGGAGVQGPPGPPGPPGETPDIYSIKAGDETVLFADGVEFARIQDGKTPVISASKSGSTTTIFANGVPIATIEDGKDAEESEGGGGGGSGGGGIQDWSSVSCISGIRFEVSGGMVRAILSRTSFNVPNTFNLHPVEVEGDMTVDVCPAEEIEVVTDESYSTATHQFTNTRRRITVLGSQAAMGQTPFTATALSEE